MVADAGFDFSALQHLHDLGDIAHMGFGVALGPRAPEDAANIDRFEETEI